MDRREKIICKCDLGGIGIEIGPSFNPIVPKSDGYNVEIIDHTDKAGLCEKYTPHGIDLDRIEEVDYVWNGESYAELTGKSNHYDYIIASHVIEHTCDLVAFLRDCSSILKENGILSLAIPDKRYCFDFLRPVSSISKVIDSHISGNTVHTPGSVYECFGSVCNSGEDIAWDCPLSPVDIRLAHDTIEAKNLYMDSLAQDRYIDIHNWAFTKNSFELLIYDLNNIGLIDLQVAASFDTVGHEFCVSLIKRKDEFIASNEERLRLAVNTKNDMEPPDADSYYSQQLEALTKQIVKQNEQIDAQKELISEIYNSRTYRTGEKFQKLYRLLRPAKPQESEGKK